MSAKSRSRWRRNVGHDDREITGHDGAKSAFSEWSEVFPNASCVVAMIDRLVHHAEILSIKGESYRRKEAQERAAAKSRKRKTKESA